jgi:mono/diheme cytochrome c family protein
MEEEMNCIKWRMLPLLHALFMLAVLTGCDYGRMYDQDSVKTYERKMPAVDQRTIPMNNGFQALRAADPRAITNPVPYGLSSIEYGKQVYSYFCIQCHGPKADGRGTVGQSLSPLPTDLASPAAQTQKDGELYVKIRLGFKRHPELFATVSDEDAWAVVNYIRSLKGGS